VNIINKIGAGNEINVENYIVTAIEIFPPEFT